jgi:RNA polymerase-binding transcription factor DksA
MVSSSVDLDRLSPESLARLRSKLLGELSAQTAHGAACRAIAADLLGHADVDSILARAGADASAARSDDAVREIQAALERLDAGTYGTCDRCGDAIRLQRLEAIPYARLCVGCHGRRPGILR